MRHNAPLEIAQAFFAMCAIVGLLYIVNSIENALR